MEVLAVQGVMIEFVAAYRVRGQMKQHARMAAIASLLVGTLRVGANKYGTRYRSTGLV